MGAETLTKCPKKKHHASLACSQSKQRAATPKGLIGAKTTEQVTIADKNCNCLLDTGSQVTTIPNSFYKHNQSHLPIEPLNKILEVEAANGQDVPYLGYIEVNITFPKSAFGLDIEVSTLALIVPDVFNLVISFDRHQHSGHPHLRTFSHCPMGTELSFKLLK